MKSFSEIYTATDIHFIKIKHHNNNYLIIINEPITHKPARALRVGVGVGSGCPSVWQFSSHKKCFNTFTPVPL
jgi:hypothetical protein